jgi:hypothetical protein
VAETFGQIRGVCAKLPSGAGVDLDIVGRYLNDRIQTIVRHIDWTRLKGETTLQTTAIYETGTVAITNGLTALTLTGGTWTAAMTGREIRLQEDDPFYLFTRTGATTGTIERAYEGETVTEATYRIFQRIYALPSDLGSIKSLKIPFTDADLDQTELEDLDKRDPARVVYGRPATFVPVKDSADVPPVPQVELWPIPEVSEGYPLRYQKKVARITSTATYIQDWISTECLFAGVEADLLALSKDYAGAQSKEQKFISLLAEMVKEDCRRRVPQQLRMADRLVRHRGDRALGHSLSLEEKRRRMP